MIVKVALFGSSGLLGSAVSSALGKRSHSYIPYSNQASVKNSKKICLSDSEQLTRQLLDEWPDVIINCAAISSSDAVTQNPEFARAINVDGAIRLAEIASHLGARYLHISTDMVFDGSSSPYRSTDIPNPLGEYGIQKLDAEKGVLAVTDENLVVLRITLINGNSPSAKRSPHERILRGIANGTPLTLFDNEIRHPCSAENVASVIVELMERPNLNGLFHWAGVEEISRYDLGLRILDRFGFSHERIQRGQLKDHLGRKARPHHLAFELAPLAGKLRTKPATLLDQMEELTLPSDLFDWYRNHADDPSRYVHKF